jgi:hypothetical protein
MRAPPQPDIHGPPRHEPCSDVSQAAELGGAHIVGFQLAIVRGQYEGKRLAFEHHELSIGRGLGNDLVLFDKGVSRNHVRIVQRSGQYWVQDLSSRNGTRLNGIRVEEAALREGDLVAIGPVLAIFNEGPEARDSDDPNPSTEELEDPAMARDTAPGLPQQVGPRVTTVYERDGIRGRRATTHRAMARR